MNRSKLLTNVIFVVSLADLACSVTAQCRCGMTNLSETLFSDIVDDSGCDAASICLINGTAVDPETYEAVKTLNCTSECFDVFGTAPTPSALAQTTSSQASVLPQSAVIAIVVGAIVVVLFVICVIGVWLRKRKRAKKKSNRVIVSQVDTAMRDDLHTIITSGSPSASVKNSEDDIKNSNPVPQVVPSSPGMTGKRQDHGDSSSDPDTNGRLDTVEYETDDSSPQMPPQTQSPPSRGESNDKSNPDELRSHPIDIAESPEWDDVELQLNHDSPRWNDTTTSLTRYLQSQGFVVS